MFVENIYDFKRVIQMKVIQMKVVFVKNILSFKSCSEYLAILISAFIIVKNLSETRRRENGFGL